METFFVLIGFVLLLQSTIALGAAIRLARYTIRETSSIRRRHQPAAVLIIPCRGVDEEFQENIKAFFAQDYRNYEIVFVTEARSDPAYPVIEKIIQENERSAWLVVAGEAADCGQKIHNLCAALETIDSVNRRAEVLVFADADSCPSANWLEELVSPLADENIGATTGFRWYLPQSHPFSFNALLLSAWNASALGVMGRTSAMAWGGATAIRREYFNQLNIREKWQGSVSDDYRLTSAIQTAGQRIKFVPAGLMSSPGNFSLARILEFTTRQMIVTRIYAPRLWWMTLVMQSLFNFAFWGGIITFLAGLFSQKFSFTLLFILSGVFLLGAVSGTLRAVVAAQLLEENRSRVINHWWGYSFLSPLVSLIYLWNLLSSAFTRKIEWRGIGYELISPEETRILYRPVTGKIEHHSAEKSQQSRKAPARSTLP
jgi:cellulose synthase/poly-beta-1,6-N-acetylglucosamine synthase-like glycosyltransferase